jgi:thiol-disulfide isomerase/thioredoxin
MALIYSTLTYSTLAAAGNLIPEVREAVERGDFGRGDAAIEQYRAQRGVTPEMIEALSWMARGALGATDLDKADAYARRTRELAAAQLRSRALDAEPRLPIALGASIEVEAQVMNARGDRTGAVMFLRKELLRYKSTSIEARLRKNINLLTLEGKRAPALEESEYLGAKPAPLNALIGKPVLLFFWAHWCGDCKADAPALARIEREYAAKKLVVIAPTQRYGYVARGEDATPAQELKYIEQVRGKYYADLLDVAMPVSAANFKSYGASTTPTFVFIDRSGVVRLYHPGAMTIEELRAALKRIL